MFLRRAFLLLFVTAAVSAAEPAALPPLLQSFVDKHELAGAVTCVVTKDKVVSLEAVGFADIAANEKMKTDSLFWIASQTKPITGVAVMMLVDEGKISLDDPVEKYLPEFREQTIKSADGSPMKPSRPFTIREAMCHVTGLPFKSAAEEPTLDGLPLEAAVKSYAKTPLVTQPGEKYQYSNAGINTAARVIEVVTKMKYEDFMQQRLFDPLGMKDTTFWPNEAQEKRVAKSYRPNAAKTDLEEFKISQLIYPLADRTRRFPMPAGGLFSTAEDVAKLCRMLLNRGEVDGKKYLSDAAFTELVKRQTPENVKDSYGVGFSVGGEQFGHGGAHATNMEVFPKKGVAVIWMVQHGGYPGEGGKAHGLFKNWAFGTFPPQKTSP